MNRRRMVFLLAIILCFMVACEDSVTTTQLTTSETIDTCDNSFNTSFGEEIPVQSFDVPYSTVLTNPTNFVCSKDRTHPLVLGDSLIKTHQLIFEFDATYPIEALHVIQEPIEGSQMVMSIAIDVSIDGTSFRRVESNIKLNEGENTIVLENEMARKVKIVFSNQEHNESIKDMYFTLGEGLVIKEEKALSNQFLRSEGWTGADGIFTFDLDNGGDEIGLQHRHTGYIFSDTFIGGVNENGLRVNFEMINNSFGYYDHELERYTFDWDHTNDEPKSVLLPDSYIGSRAANLLDGDGLSLTHQPQGLLTNVNEGTMWLTDESKPELVIDLHQSYDVSAIYLWNYNANPDYGVKAFDLYQSIDGNDYVKIGHFQLDKASGLEQEPFTTELVFNQNTTRFLKIKVTESYNDEFVGLGKIRLFSAEGQCLFGDIQASSEMTEVSGNEESARLWLQDGIVIGDKLYVFPLLVKDNASLFKVHQVGLIEVPIVEKQFSYQDASYYHTPLMVQTADDGTIYFGAGVMDNRNIDGYIYVYGYKDLAGRHLVVSRMTESNFLLMNEWTYFDGETWVKDIEKAAPLKEGVSAELSVTYMPSGIFAGKYLLVAMENTTSGKIVYSVSDTPYGPFSEFTTIYQTTESDYLTKAFSYNAKLHPNLSTADRWIISYNVNTTSLSALRDANIYYPRFISVTEVKKEGETQ